MKKHITHTNKEIRTMRIFIIILLQISFVQITFAQNALFLPFNTSRVEVKEFLNSRDYIKEVYHTENNITVKLNETSEIVYNFEAGKLSSISMVKTYGKKKAGKSAIHASVGYMGLSAEVFMPSLTNDKNNSKYYSIAGDKVLELDIERDGKHTQIQLTSIDRHQNAQAAVEAQEWMNKL